MDKVLIGAVLVCLVAGLGIGYLIGYVTYPLPVVDLRQQWATLHIDAAAGTRNYTARYRVTWEDGTAIPLTEVHGPSITYLNITRPKDAAVGGFLGGWYIEVWATVTPYNGITPTSTDITTIIVSWAGPKMGFDGSRAYGTYPAEAHIRVHLS